MSITWYLLCWYYLLDLSILAVNLCKLTAGYTKRVTVNTIHICILYWKCRCSIHRFPRQHFLGRVDGVAENCDCLDRCYSSCLDSEQSFIRGGGDFFYFISNVLGVFFFLDAIKWDFLMPAPGIFLVFLCWYYWIFLS